MPSTSSKQARYIAYLANKGGNKDAWAKEWHEEDKKHGRLKEAFRKKKNNER